MDGEDLALVHVDRDAAAADGEVLRGVESEAFSFLFADRGEYRVTLKKS